MNVNILDKTLTSSFDLSDGLGKIVERSDSSLNGRLNYGRYPSDYMPKRFSKEEKKEEEKKQRLINKLKKQEDEITKKQEKKTTVIKPSLLDIAKTGAMGKLQERMVVDSSFVNNQLKEEEMCQTQHTPVNESIEMLKKQSTRRDCTHLLKDMQQRRMTSTSSSRGSIHQIRNNIEDRVRTINVEYQTKEDQEFIVTFFSKNFQVRRVNMKSSIITIILEDPSIAEFIVSHGGIANDDKMYIVSGYHWDGSVHMTTPPTPIPITSSSMREIIEKDKKISQPGFVQRTLQNITSLFQSKQ